MDKNKVQAVANGLDQVDLTLDNQLPELKDKAQLLSKTDNPLLEGELVDLSSKIDGRLQQLHSKIPVLTEEYLLKIQNISNYAKDLQKVMAPAASGSPTGSEEQEDKAVELLVNISKESQEILSSELAQIDYFRNVIRKESEALVLEIEKLANTEISVYQMYEKLEKIINLPSSQKNRINNISESVQVEIDQIRSYCAILKNDIN